MKKAWFQFCKLFFWPKMVFFKIIELFVALPFILLGFTLDLLNEYLNKFIQLFIDAIFGLGQDISNQVDLSRDRMLEKYYVSKSNFKNGIYSPRSWDFDA